ncbi:hypothetical protein PILCRDRAFT_586452 [Piloderma croceum F 1598]|uniref:Transcription initiation factor TFIID subunit 12 domain-containing protein n=1 Tax=Piloderma croceum (strain F 1598) TaxID=765440 RepID=A0A0C3FF96_PILCF|nr:hypothetical protein PILCRDRAFT_586452 [Piloderma croceum F 1598]
MGTLHVPVENRAISTRAVYVRDSYLLTIADEFVDSVTNFGCRLSKHRGGDTRSPRPPTSSRT